jgi:hypothetical protein
MDWAALGAIGEIVGALGVVISLLFVARQLRANTSAMRSAAYGAVLSTQADITSAFAVDERMVGLFRRMIFDRQRTEEFTDDERMALGMSLLAVLATWQNAYFQAVRERVVDSDVTTVMFRGSVTNTPYFQEFWKRNKEELAPQFVQFLEHRHPALVSGPRDEATDQE